MLYDLEFQDNLAKHKRNQTSEFLFKLTFTYVWCCYFLSTKSKYNINLGLKKKTAKCINILGKNILN